MRQIKRTYLDPWDPYKVKPISKLVLLDFTEGLCAGANAKHDGNRENNAMVMEGFMFRFCEKGKAFFLIFLACSAVVAGSAVAGGRRMRVMPTPRVFFLSFPPFFSFTLAHISPIKQL